jgi:hypothetical protein
MQGGQGSGASTPDDAATVTSVSARGAAGDHRSSGSSGQAQQRAAASGNWGKVKAAIAVEVWEQHAARAKGEEDAQLKAWLLDAGRQLESADTAYQTARTTFQQVGE